MYNTNRISRDRKRLTWKTTTSCLIKNAFCLLLFFPSLFLLIQKSMRIFYSPETKREGSWLCFSHIKEICLSPNRLSPTLYFHLILFPGHSCSSLGTTNAFLLSGTVNIPHTHIQSSLWIQYYRLSDVCHKAQRRYSTVIIITVDLCGNWVKVKLFLYIFPSIVWS